jgi:hypothetical protein
MTPEEHRQKVSEATSVAMKAYWAQPGVRRYRKAATRRRRHIRRLRSYLANPGLHAELRERLQRELEDLLAQHEQVSAYLRQE